ncbi:uncharacterized protein LOC143240220 [Tachypleus tridentatus]|uniref:uncharacterized protein LOC143240220 n=1 Tax=Tachypleus tridentatus TaxID=6853 RepID=UPI003FD6B44A
MFSAWLYLVIPSVFLFAEGSVKQIVLPHNEGKANKDLIIVTVIGVVIVLSTFAFWMCGICSFITRIHSRSNSDSSISDNSHIVVTEDVPNSDEPCVTEEIDYTDYDNHCLDETVTIEDY